MRIRNVTGRLNAEAAAFLWDRYSSAIEYWLWPVCEIWSDRALIKRFSVAFETTNEFATD